MSLSRSSLVVALLLIAAPVRADVIVVEPGGHFTTVQQAVHLAQDGDVLLFKGNWSGPAETVTLGEDSVALIADAGATVKIGRIVVSELAPGKTVLLRGLSLAAGFPASAGAGLELVDDGGAVRVENCSITGCGGSPGTWNPTFSPLVDGFPGVSAIGCADVALHACTLTGGIGATIDDDDYQLGATNGGPGLVILDSVVTVHGCSLNAGHGGDAYDGGGGGGYGGDGARNSGGTLYLEDCTATGGNQGSGDCDVSGCGGNGGVGRGFVSLGDSAFTTVRAGDYINGKLLSGQVYQGSGLEVVTGTLVGDHSATDALALSSPVRELQVATVTVSGKAGDLVFALISLAPGQKPLPQQHGVVLVAAPFAATHVALGVIDASGTFSLPLAAPELPAGVDELTAWLQIAVKRGSMTLLGAAASVTVLDESF